MSKIPVGATCLIPFNIKVDSSLTEAPLINPKKTGTITNAVITDSFFEIIKIKKAAIVKNPNRASTMNWF